MPDCPGCRSNRASICRAAEFRGGYADLQVWTVESGDEYLCLTAEQPFDDVPPCDGIGRRCEGAKPGVREVIRQFGEATVVRPEVVAPLRHAMRLVDREPRRTMPGEAIEYVRLHEPFRRDVEQAQSTVAQLAVCLGGVRPRRRRIECARRHPVDAQRGCLVAHQREFPRKTLSILAPRFETLGCSRFGGNRGKAAGWSSSTASIMCVSTAEQCMCCGWSDLLPFAIVWRLTRLPFRS